MKVLVIGMNGIGLMPTTPRKARIILKEGRAVIVRKKPFTIKLLYKTGSTSQPVEIGIDTGSQHIGVAIVSEGKVLEKSEYELRSSMEKRELIKARAEFRGNRRYRKTRYRHPKYKYHTKRTYHAAPVKRKKAVIEDGVKKTITVESHWAKEKTGFTSDRPEGWLPPSIQSKTDHHVRIINNHKEALPLNTHLTIEIARFDIAKIKNPDIQGEEYQFGALYQYENVKAYVFSRDNYTCKICGAKGGATRKDGSRVKLICHHRDYRSNGSTDNPDVLFTVCDGCHTAKNHAPGGILYEYMQKHKKFARGYRDMTVMNIVSKRLRDAFPDASITYGNITQANRELLGLVKTHANDAVAIAMSPHIQETGDLTIQDSPTTVYYKQVRIKKRSLHEANPRKGRSKPNTTATRNSKNKTSSHRFCRNDSVTYDGKKCWVQSFAGDYRARLQDEDGNYVKPKGKSHTSINLSELKYKHHNNGWRVYEK